MIDAVTMSDREHNARRFARWTREVQAALPGPLKRLPDTFIGFAAINLFTFSVDMVLLWITHGLWGFPYPFAVTISYGAASVLAFALNKILNFRSHGFVEEQSSEFAVVIISNYVIWILLLSSLLEYIGVHYLVARVTAACIEGLYIYILSRVWVFRLRRMTAARRARELRRRKLSAKAATAARAVRHPRRAKAQASPRRVL
ncbi:MAG: hypothetical protein CSA58_00995 [Micrococcales bacterium]|nr:MAG: hypothetical protein CSA58_00995 [Micrococcales bacterium]